MKKFEKVSFKDFVSGKALPLCIDDFDCKVAEAEQMRKEGRISEGRCDGLKDELAKNVDNEARAILENRKMEKVRALYKEMAKDMRTLSTLF